MRWSCCCRALGGRRWLFVHGAARWWCGLLGCRAGILLAAPSTALKQAFESSLELVDGIGSYEGHLVSLLSSMGCQAVLFISRTNSRHDCDSGNTVLPLNKARAEQCLHCYRSSIFSTRVRRAVLSLWQYLVKSVGASAYCQEESNSSNG